MRNHLSAALVAALQTDRAQPNGRTLPASAVVTRRLEPRLTTALRPKVEATGREPSARAPPSQPPINRTGPSRPGLDSNLASCAPDSDCIGRSNRQAQLGDPNTTRPER